MRLLVIIIFCCLVLPLVAVAANTKTVTLPNPIGAGRDDPAMIIGDIIAKVMGVLGTLALAVFCWGGIMWITSAGAPERIKTGQQTLLWAAIGLLVIFASYAILKYVLGVFG
jgi:hypothetical protein